MTVEQAIVAEWDVSPRIVAFSTLRSGGTSKPPYDSLNLATHVGDDLARVSSNRALLQERLPQSLTWQWLDQVHGTMVAQVDRAGEVLTADALVTKRPNLVCCVQTADCLPLFVAAVDGSEVAVIHAGWKGLASGVIESTIDKMSAPVSRLAVWLGPAIGPCHFGVGAEVKSFFLERHGSPASISSLEACFVPGKNSGKYLADLYAVARLKLSELGMKNVSGGAHCTHCDEQRFFSYRRDGATGRMLNAIYIEA